MNAYMYQADLFCESCGEAFIDELTDQGEADEGDSDRFPQPVEVGEADSPLHCGSGPDCLEAEVLFTGQRVGKFFENDLTDEGWAYVRKAIKKGERFGLSEIWGEYYFGVSARPARPLGKP